MADGLLGSITPDDRMLGLLGIGLGMLANARGRNGREAFQNSLGGAVEGGMGMLGPIMQSAGQRAAREMQAKQLGLQERTVAANEEMNKLHAKLYGAQAAEMDRKAKFLEAIMGGAPGAGAPPTLAPGPDGTMIGTPGTQPPIQSGPAGGMPAAPAGGGQFNIDPTLLKGAMIGYPEIGKGLATLYEMDQPKIDYVGGIAVDKRTGRPVQGAPTLPQMSQPGLGYQNMPDPSSPTGYRVVPVPGGLDLLGAQRGVAAGAEAAARAPYETPRTVKLPDGREVLMRPDQFTAFAGGVPPAPAGTPSPRQPSPATQPGAGSSPADRVRILEGEMATARPEDRGILIEEINRARTSAGMPLYQSQAGMPGVVSGKTTAQQIVDKRTETGAVNEAELGQRRIADLQKEAMGQQGILNTIDQIETQLKKPVLGPGPVDRSRMLLHNIGVQDEASINTSNIRNLGEQLVLARGSLGAGVSVADADRYEKAAGAFTRAKSREEMVASIEIMKSIAKRYFEQTNNAIGRYSQGGGAAMTVGPDAGGFKVLR